MSSGFASKTDTTASALMGSTRNETVDVVKGMPSIQYPKWLGGSASCMAVALSHPLDLTKVRMQAAPHHLKKGTFATMGDIFTKEGPRGFYSGLSAGLLRQLTYGSTRFAIYETAKENVSANGQATSNLLLLPLAAFSGFCGGIVGNPADIANVRMQNDRSLPLEQRRNYRNVLEALVSIGRESGPNGYFRGLLPNCIRAASMTAFQLASYDYSKSVLTGRLGMADNPVTQFISSIFASLVATTLGNPIDVLKTQIMSSSAKKDSVASTVESMSRKDGLRWVWRGWLPSFARLGPHTVATLILLEQHRVVYRNYFVSNQNKSS